MRQLLELRHYNVRFEKPSKMVKKRLTLAMNKIALAVLGFPAFCSCIIYIDRFTAETNKKYSNVTIAVRPDKDGNSVTNITATTFTTFLELRVYIKIIFKEDQEYRREFLRTVINVEKLANDLQRNIILKSYMDSLKKLMDFEVKFPLKHVSSFWNQEDPFSMLTLDSKFLPLINDTEGYFDLRFVGKVDGSSKTVFLMHNVFYGGFRRG